jgi:hypothetical protein
MKAFRELHSQELDLILDELRDIASSAEAAPAGPGEGAPTLGATSADPAAASPKRAKWLEEQERRAHLSRRDLLRGRERTEP